MPDVKNLVIELMDYNSQKNVTFSLNSNGKAGLEISFMSYVNCSSEKTQFNFDQEDTEFLIDAIKFATKNNKD